MTLDERPTDNEVSDTRWSLTSRCAFSRPTCAGDLLWANNAIHLDYLESYVAAALRERSLGPATLQWYLPSWMKHAKNREEIPRAIARLRTWPRVTRTSRGVAIGLLAPRSVDANETEN